MATKFGKFIEENDYRCKLCRFFESHPDEAKDIRSEIAKSGRISGTLISKYLVQEFGVRISMDVVVNHFRRAHEGRKF